MCLIDQIVSSQTKSLWHQRAFLLLWNRFFYRLFGQVSREAGAASGCHPADHFAAARLRRDVRT
jgi:hypothetical protein